MKFSRETFANLSKLLDDLLGLPEQERQSFLEQAGGSDEETKTLLNDLLSQHLESGSPLSYTPVSGGGIILGPYRLIRKIGRGGMGTVWLAERADGVLKRSVALKLPHTESQVGSGMLDRFGRERDILAALTHPHIARLYDAGIYEGQPYLALEYVEGINLNEYCDCAQLNVEARIRLFLQVLGAVQYAHSHLVIHRDLKPSNILVTAQGEVRLLDFGIAKLLVSEENGTDELTRTGSRLLTPSYASPEQITGELVSTASDIYALGVVLYELLTGCRPYRLKRETGAALEQAILETAPVPPSQATVTLPAAEARAATMKKLSAHLKGDLDSILLKALKKNPQDRYATADAFASDLERYLAGELVLAQPDTRFYRVRKFISRHRLPLSVAAAVCLVVAIALGTAIWQFRIAETQARQAAAVGGFLEDIFRANSDEQSDPLKAQQTTARELLEIGAKKIDHSLNDTPAVKLRVLKTLEEMYHGLGMDEQAVDLARRSVALSRKLYGSKDVATAQALSSLGSALHASRSVNEREKVLLEAKHILDDRHDTSSSTRANLDRIFAEHYQSTNVSKQLEYATEAVALFRRLPPPQPDITEALYSECMAYRSLSQYELAESSISQAIHESKKTYGDPNTQLPRYCAYQAEARQNLLNFAGAEESARAALEAALKTRGESHIDVLETQMMLGSILFGNSKPAEALTHLEIAKNLAFKLRGPSDPFYTPPVYVSYGFSLVQFGRLEEGLTYLEQADQIRRKNRHDTVFMAQILHDEAYALVRLGRYEEADALLAEAALIRTKTGSSEERVSIDARAGILRAAGKKRDAAVFLEAYAQTDPHVKGLSLGVLNRMQAKAEAALDRDDPASAVQLAKSVLTQIKDRSLDVYLKDYRSRMLLMQGRAYLMLRRPQEALPLLRTAVQLRAGTLDALSPDLADAQVALGLCDVQLHNSREARALLASAKKIHSAHRQLGSHYTRPLTELAAALNGKGSV